MGYGEDDGAAFGGGGGGDDGGSCSPRGMPLAEENLVTLVSPRGGREAGGAGGGTLPMGAAAQPREQWFVRAGADAGDRAERASSLDIIDSSLAMLATSAPAAAHLPGRRTTRIVSMPTKPRR